MLYDSIGLISFHAKFIGKPDFRIVQPFERSLVCTVQYSTHAGITNTVEGIHKTGSNANKEKSCRKGEAMQG
jgi:hypothetical protein